MEKIRNISVVGLLAFILFFISGYIIGYKESISTYKLFMQLFIGCLYFAAFYLCVKLNNIQSTLCLVFLISLALSFTLRFLFLDYTGNAYEGIMCDTVIYESMALKGIGIPYNDYIGMLRTSVSSFNMDDLGYFSYLYVWHNIFRDVDFVRYLLMALNVGWITISSYLMFCISRELGFDDYVGNINSSLYGLFPYWLTSSAMGDKENLFCFIILCSLYFICKFQNNRKFTSLLCAIFFAILAYFFRFAISLMIIILIFVAFVANEYNKKKILLYMTVLALFFLFFLNVILVNTTDVYLDTVQRTTYYRMKQSTGGGVVGWFVQIFSAFLGPFPNFLRTNRSAFYFSSGLLFKDMLGIFALLGIWKVVKNYSWHFYPIAAFFIMGSLMLIVSAVSLDMRYHITFFSAFLLLSSYGIEFFDRKVVYCSYLLVSFLLILMYNFR